MFLGLCVQQRMPAYTSVLLTYTTYTKPTPNLFQRALAASVLVKIHIRRHTLLLYVPFLIVAPSLSH